MENDKDTFQNEVLCKTSRRGERAMEISGGAGRRRAAARILTQCA